ncbi:putative exported domain protein [[Clostridium] sordellii ATCC 9714]|nr:putative exported domain protein [[Clostridium] sordellii ATCC 9714] [Paeniclostridium sordellii ATCC 9714]
MCEKVVKTYEAMDVPKLKNEENTAILNDAKKCVQKAYILRGKAMDCAQELLNSKNLKYVSEIKEYLRLSDLEIEKFLNNMKQL